MVYQKRKKAKSLRGRRLHKDARVGIFKQAVARGTSFLPRRIKFHKATTVATGFHVTNSRQTSNSIKLSSVQEGKSRSRSNSLIGDQLELAVESDWLCSNKTLRDFDGHSHKNGWIHQLPVGAGLHNLGNSCYMNATLQSLIYCPPLAKYLLQRCHSRQRKKNIDKDSRRTVGLNGNPCFFTLLEKHIRRSFGNISYNSSANSKFNPFQRVKPFSPTMIHKKLRLIGRQFRRGRQEDAHEFLRLLVDALQKSCLIKFGLSPNIINRVSETTFVFGNFGGYTRSQIKCQKCNFCSNTYDPFMDLSLELPRGVSSISDALQMFTQTETLDYNNMYKCSRCKKLSRAKKKISIHQSPQILMLHLKRFRFGRQGRKISRQIAYPETLNMNKYISDSSNTIHNHSNNYELYSVLVHSGDSLSCGHYYSLNKTTSGIWFCMDDSSVSQVGIKEVLNQSGAYILFYRRISPRVVLSSKSNVKSAKSSTIKSDLSRNVSSQKNVKKNNEGIDKVTIDSILRGVSDFSSISTNRTEIAKASKLRDRQMRQKILRRKRKDDSDNTTSNIENVKFVTEGKRPIKTAHTKDIWNSNQCNDTIGDKVSDSLACSTQRRLPENDTANWSSQFSHNFTVAVNSDSSESDSDSDSSESGVINNNNIHQEDIKDTSEIISSGINHNHAITNFTTSTNTLASDQNCANQLDETTIHSEDVKDVSDNSGIIDHDTADVGITTYDNDSDDSDDSDHSDHSDDSDDLLNNAQNEVVELTGDRVRSSKFRNIHQKDVAAAKDRLQIQIQAKACIQSKTGAKSINTYTAVARGGGKGIFPFSKTAEEPTQWEINTANYSTTDHHKVEVVDAEMAEDLQRRYRVLADDEEVSRLSNSKRRRDHYDYALDSGKQKKVKTKLDSNDDVYEKNLFQEMHDRKLSMGLIQKNGGGKRTGKVQEGRRDASQYNRDKDKNRGRGGRGRGGRGRGGRGRGRGHSRGHSRGRGGRGHSRGRGRGHSRGRGR